MTFCTALFERVFQIFCGLQIVWGSATVLAFVAVTVLFGNFRSHSPGCVSFPLWGDSKLVDVDCPLVAFSLVYGVLPLCLSLPLSCSLSPVLSAMSVISSLTCVRVYSFMGNHCTGDVSQLFLSNCFSCFVASDRVGVCHSLCRIFCRRRRSSAISVELVRTLLSGVFHAPCDCFSCFKFVASDRVGVCHSLCRISCRRRSSAISVDLVRTLLSGVISRAVRLFLLFWFSRVTTAPWTTPC